MKKLSTNSRNSYRYDLQQFVQFFEQRQISKESLLLYQESLSSMAISAQKRKISAINQFLYFLYEQEKMPHFLQLKKVKLIEANSVEIPHMRDFSSFYKKIESPGQFIALLILETGLTPSEICQLKWENFNWRFNVLQIEQKGIQRVIALQNKFSVRAKIIRNADELFSKTRQSIHKELKKYTDYTARELREQFILKKVQNGLSIYELAEILGLKTTLTLEKYYKEKVN
ncbi:MAG: site-specific tyrosine recombinase XerD [Lactovum sp.]